MLVTIPEAHGYCHGVKRALELVKKTLDDNTVEKPIYILGNIIHNDLIKNAIEERGVIILEGKSRLDMLDEINSGTVIFSAHGVSDKVYQKAQEKHLNIVDATCPMVLANKKRIKKHLEDGYEIIFIGKKKHPETEGLTSDYNNINIISNDLELNNIAIDDTKKYYAINQTTLSILDIKNIKDYIENKYQNVLFENSICLETTKRQTACMNVEADLAIVVGSKSSSNSSKLKLMLETNGIKTIQIDSVIELYDYDFTCINSVFVTSGASTPEVLTNEVLEFLRENKKSSHTSDDLF